MEEQVEEELPFQGLDLHTSVFLGLASLGRGARVFCLFSLPPRVSV